MVYIKDPQKKAKYLEALENEKQVLQKIINDMGIDETIKRMKFEWSKKYYSRTVLLEFKSKYTSAHGYRVNRWAGVEMLWIGELNLNQSNLIHWNPCTISGAIYNNERWEDGKKIAELLRNRYWVWIRQIDRLIKRDIEYHEKMKELHPDWYIINFNYADEIDKTYQAAKYACNEISIPIKDAVKLYNEQIESGLIYDSEYGKIDYPEDHILEEHPIEDFQSNKGSNYLNSYQNRILG